MLLRQHKFCPKAVLPFLHVGVSITDKAFASFVKLSACQRTKTVSDYYKHLEASGWLRHIRTLLECGNFLATSIIRGISCVVHCSDGWDRTAQTVSIAQLLLDPFFRTIRGFQVLYFPIFGCSDTFCKWFSDDNTLHLLYDAFVTNALLPLPTQMDYHPSRLKYIPVLQGVSPWLCCKKIEK